MQIGTHINPRAHSEPQAPKRFLRTAHQGLGPHHANQHTISCHVLSFYYTSGVTRIIDTHDPVFIPKAGLHAFILHWEKLSLGEMYHCPQVKKLICGSIRLGLGPV